MTEVLTRHASKEEGLRGPVSETPMHRLLVCIPTTGTVRFEWAMQLTQLIYPVNWSQSMAAPDMPIYGPMGFAVAAARNQCVAAALEKGFEWIFFLDHDTIPPADILLRWNHYMLKKEVPMVAGLYYHKGMPSYPLVFKQLGKGPFLDWKRGEKVWCSGMPMGCTLIHTSIFQHLPRVSLTDGTGGEGWYDTPRFAWEDPETGEFHREVGTEDLNLCERIMRHDVFRKAGWPEVAEKEFPFLIDTRIWCTHIDAAGICFPAKPPEPGESARAALEEDF